MSLSTTQKVESFSRFDELPAAKKLQILATTPPHIDMEKELAERIGKYVAISPDFSLLYGTERIDDTIMEALFSLAKETRALTQMKKMQRGEIVNAIDGYPSENRPALHTALRDFFDNPQATREAVKATAEAKNELEKVKKFLLQLQSEKHFSDLVVIGIGGSELGPQAAYQALSHLTLPEKKVHFINNIDPDSASALLRSINLKNALVAVLSKGGTTLETVTNEEIFREALRKANLNVQEHMVVVTQKGSSLDKEGLYRERFYIWDWVGGRYSVTSAIGALPLGFALGFEPFYELLQGAHSMDKNSENEQLNQNLPLLGALLSIWNHNFLQYPTLAVIPYAQQLHRLAAHIQQVEMESNGKSIDRSGRFVNYKTGLIIFGEPGTSCQHSFFQMVHQGKTIIPVEFIGFKQCAGGSDFWHEGTSSQQKLLANLFAQAVALALGQKSDNPNKSFSGNRPTHILIGEKITPHSVGALLSYFENKIVFEGFILGINSFDQEGVQLGKQLANGILKLFAEKNEKKRVDDKNSAAAAFLKYL